MHTQPLLKLHLSQTPGSASGTHTVNANHERICQIFRSDFKMRCNRDQLSFICWVLCTLCIYVLAKPISLHSCFFGTTTLGHVFATCPVYSVHHNMFTTVTVMVVLLCTMYPSSQQLTYAVYVWQGSCK